jgi:hypothetical protein
VPEINPSSDDFPMPAAAAAVTAAAQEAECATAAVIRCLGFNPKKEVPALSLHSRQLNFELEMQLCSA